VAIKMATPSLIKNAGLQQRIVREMKALAQLSHPNIVQILETQLDDPVYFVMEFFPGVSLRSGMLGSPWPIERVLSVGLQIARALEHAHRQGVTHRDIKPENILLTGDDFVKVVDFGLVLIDGATAVTRSAQHVGTPLYMSPEQLGAPGGVGPHSDVYALGLVLFELLTGSPAFEAADWLQRMGRSPERLPSHPVLGDRCADLVAACVSVSTATRPTAGSLVAQMETLTAELTAKRNTTITTI
jgi:serine/threonine protein kinase